MKFVFSWNCRLGAIFLILIDICIVICSVCFSNIIEDIIFFGFFDLFCISVTSFLIYKSRNNLTTVEITDKGFSTSILNKKWCFVDKNLPIYYAVLSGERTRRLHFYNNLIIVSNEPIENKVIKNVVYCSKLKKHIIMPYNKDVLAYCELSKWNNVNSCK